MNKKMGNYILILLLINTILLCINFNRKFLSRLYYKNCPSMRIIIPNLNKDNETKYYYKIDGYDNKWKCTNSDELNLGDLPSGKYNIRIKAKDSKGTFSDETVSRFEIKPPIWKSKYAIAIYILILGILFIYNKKKLKYLDKLINKRTKDLTEEMGKNKLLFNKVIELEKSKNSYFVNLSHELRTPLNVVYSTCQLISELNKEDQGIDRKRLEHYMDVSKKNTLRLLQIINDLIDISKMQNNSYLIDIKENDIVALVEDSALSLKDYVEEKGISMIIDPEIEEKIIECDKGQIERCIINLVGNASKFTPCGGYIKVTIKDLNDKIRIEVIDNGTGIDKKYHDYIFNRFNQVCNDKTVCKGSGLGLTITKQIVDNHNGEIFVESELNKGSKFVIILPSKYADKQYINE